MLSFALCDISQDAEAIFHIPKSGDLFVNISDALETANCRHFHGHYSYFRKDVQIFKQLLEVMYSLDIVH